MLLKDNFVRLSKVASHRSFMKKLLWEIYNFLIKKCLRKKVNSQGIKALLAEKNTLNQNTYYI